MFLNCNCIYCDVVVFVYLCMLKSTSMDLYCFEVTFYPQTYFSQAYFAFFSLAVNSLFISAV